jgi:hypothetical protein
VTRLRLSIDDPLVAVVISIMFLMILGLASFAVWNYVYSVSVAWVISDFILNLVIQGGGGWARIPIAGNLFTARGRAFLAFFFGIVIATWLSSIGTEWIFLFAGLAVRSVTINPTNSTLLPVVHVIATSPTFFTLLFANLIVGALVYLDLNVRFYKR